MSNLLYLSQNFSTTLNVPSGITDSQTTGIVLTSVTGLDTNGGILALDWAATLDTDTIEYIEYGGLSGNELTGVVRGAEGVSAKAHANGCTVVAVVSKAHVNRIAAKLAGDDDGVTLTDPVLDGDLTGTAILDEDDMASDSATQVPTQQSVKAYVDANSGSSDGWTEISDTLTYASATTFTVAGDQTSKYSKGTRIRLTQTTVKYFVVTNASHSSGTTTVTITGGTDYTLASAAITDPFYSYQANPQGYPGWFNYAPAWTNTSSNPSMGNGNLSAKFSVVGATCNVLLKVIMGSTTSYGSGTQYSFSLPITALDGTIGSQPGSCTLLDASAGFWIAAAVVATTTTFTATPMGSGAVSNRIHSTNPFTFTSTDAIYMNLSYQF